MINKYFSLVKEAEDLEAEAARKLSSLAKEQKDLKEGIDSKLRSLADDTVQIIRVTYFLGSFHIIGTHFSSSFNEDGTWSTSKLCTSNGMPNTLESAVEKTEEMFKAKEEWEELLVKIDEVLKEQ